MSIKHNFLKVFSIIALLAMIFSNIQPSIAQAQTDGNGDGRKVTNRGGDGIRRKVNAKSGKLSFIGPESGRSLSAARALGISIPPQNPAMALAQRFAPEFGVKDPVRDLMVTKHNRNQDGRLMVRYQQTYRGIPIIGAELIINTNDSGDLYSMNGEVSPDISLPTQPTIDSATAKATALEGTAKLYQKTPEEFVVAEPALWVYDESLLKESTRPVELVWRMDVTAKDDTMPVRELVLVNAQSGEISLHFNQIDTAWHTPIESPQNIQHTTTATKIFLPITQSIGTLTDTSMPANQSAQTPTTLTITTVSPEPSIKGNPVTVSVTVTGGLTTPTGTVNIDGGGTAICALTLVGGAGSCALTFNSTGLKTINATYNGDSTNAPSTATPVSHEVLDGSRWYVAMTGSDGNSCSTSGAPCATINGAIGKASSGDSIVVAVGTYTGSGTEAVSINKNLTLSGGWNASFTSQSGMSTIDGQTARRGITVNLSITSTVERFIIQNGYVACCNDWGGGLYSLGNLTLNSSQIINNGGGGIYNRGVLTINNGTISHNAGGGIANQMYNLGSGILTLNSSTVESNSSPANAGGISNGNIAILNNSTISGNSAIGEGGGIVTANGSLTINNSTIVGNSITGGSGGGGGGIYHLSGSVILQNTLIAKNFSWLGPDCASNTFGTGTIIVSNGYNLIGNNSSCNISSATGDQIGTHANPINPRVTPLQDNGGPTLTYALMSGSPAIDAGNPLTCLSSDQRGVARPVGAKCDIGAYEGSVPWGPSPYAITYASNNTPSIPGSFLCDQTKPNCTNNVNPHADAAHKYAIGTYGLYATQFSRDSIDNHGMTIVSTVQYCDSHLPCPLDNAFWNGQQMLYGSAHGYPLADDVVAHELTHGVTQYESELLYYYQSGAINESMSDVFGEYYDQTNGQGNDNHNPGGVKWQLGEDVTGMGALRSMSNPPAYGDPDKMSSPNYFTGGDDNGGVHYNSGVNNKAAYLMVDGASFNGKTVTGIGWDKTAAIYYEANTNLLTSTADYSDLYYALQQACINLLGTKGITSADCVQVKNALDAVEMNARQTLGNFDDPSFEYSYATYPYWDQYSKNFETPLCTTADCGTMGGTAGPRTSSVWTWFGGTTRNENAWVSQQVYFPRGYPSLRLKFYLWIGRADRGSDANDKFMAQVDGVTVFTANARQKSSYSSYKQVVVDVSAFARNAQHTITFSSVTSGQIVNFNLDDVSLGDDLHTITGNVGLANAVLQYADNGPKSVSADGSGNYSITVPFNWSGIVTPYKNGYTFTPASKSYSNVQVNQTAQNYTAQVCLDCADVKVSIGIAQVGNYTVAPAPSTMDRYTGIVDGPVKVVSNTGGNILASQQAIYGNSFNELMGYPANKFSKEYWFPWYDQLFMKTWILVGNPSTTQTAYVDIYIGGVRRTDATGAVQTYVIAPGANITPVFPGILNGPVRVVSVTGNGTASPINIFASERSLYGTSFNEVMGYPTEQFATEYWFPWYDQMFMDSWVLVGNPSTSQTAYVDIYIGGTKRTDTNGFLGTYEIPPNGNITPVFPGVVDGPVRVVSVTGISTPTPLKVFSSERSLYGSSFNEVMGYPTDQLTTDYYFPWYDNNAMKTWVLIGNPSSIDTAYVDIYIGGVKVNDTAGGVPYEIEPNGNITPTFNLDNGPVKVVSVTGPLTMSPIDIFASERTLYGPSFNEMMGYPGDQLASEYWFTWYDNTFMQTSIYIAKP